MRWLIRWLSRATCTSGEPVSPSVVAYSAMIFFLVSASVPIDMRGSLPARSGHCSLRGAPGPVHPGTLVPRPSDGDRYCVVSPGTAKTRAGNRTRLSAATGRAQSQPIRQIRAQTAGGGGSCSVRRSVTACDPSGVGRGGHRAVGAAAVGLHRGQHDHQHPGDRPGCSRSSSGRWRRCASCTAKARIKPRARRKTPSPYPMGASLRGRRPQRATPSSARLPVRHARSKRAPRLCHD